MEQEIKKSTIIKNLMWKLSERFTAQIVSFLVSLILARLLAPDDYGLVALITVFIAIANVFVTSGFGNSLIQKKDATETDFSSVFYFSIFVGVVVYILLFLIAPLIAKFYDNDSLTSLLRVLSLSVIFAGINSVQEAYVSRNMLFKKFFFSTIIGTIISAIIGIIMAFRGFGAWALVFQTLINQLVNTIVLWYTVGWRPILKFSLKSMQQLFSFGWKLLVSSIIDTIYNNIYSLVIGKCFSAKSLGYYNRGKAIPNMIISNINGSIQSVMFPAFSRFQNNLLAMKNVMRRAILTSTFIIVPAMIGVAAIGRPITILLLTEKWLPSVPFLQFSCFILAFYPIHTTNLQVINAMGRSDIYLKLEIIKKIIGFVILLVSIPFGIYGMMIGSCISTIICSIVNSFPNKKLLNYGYFEQIKDILPVFILSITMGLVINLWTILDLNIIIALFIQVITGVIIYLLGSKIFKLEAYTYIVGILKKENNFK